MRGEHVAEGSAEQLIEALGLQRHPEGGWYREHFRGAPGPDGRTTSTAIYFLLRRGERSHWHRLHTAVEIWHHYAGAPLELAICTDAERADAIERRILGTDIAAGEALALVVPAGAWQAARSLGAWTLCGCTVAPGFEFADFELAAPDWSPSGWVDG